MGYRFGPKCKHAQEIHTTVCSDPEILLPWQVDVMTSPLYPFKRNWTSRLVAEALKLRYDGDFYLRSLIRTMGKIYTYKLYKNLTQITQKISATGQRCS